MPIAMKDGDGTCGNCGTKLEELGSTKDDSVLTICHGCGIVCGTGAAQEEIEAWIAIGKGKRIDAAPGFYAMRLIGGPST